MSNWISPNIEALKDVVSASRGRLLLCSPYISTPALNVVANALPKRVDAVEIWTKLDIRDWLTGASDPEGLLDFTRQVETSTGPVSIRHARHLHAKIVVSSGPMAMAGSANLTAGGFIRNIEIARVITGREVDRLHTVVNSMRPNLLPITRDQFAQFVSECTAKERTKEDLLDLIRQEIPALTLGPGALEPYHHFLSYLKSRRSNLAREILRIANNEDGNNNTGKVKQAFFGVQRFLQEYPHRREFIESLPLRWFDVAESDLLPEWKNFLNDFSGEVNDLYAYSIPTLRGYLPEAYGGTLRGGGGGSNELKRVWPYAGRAIRTFNP